MISAPWPPPRDEVERATQGDRAASEALHRAIQPRLGAFLRYHGFDTATREDIATDVSEAVLTKINTLRNPVTFEAWFWTIARNQVHGWMRRKQRDADRSDLMLPSPIPPDETVIAGEEHHAIRDALARLSEKDRNLLWLREVEELSYRDISNRLGAATGAIRVRCHRARQRLEAAYEEVSSSGDQADRANRAQRPASG